MKNCIKHLFLLLGIPKVSIKNMYNVLIYIYPNRLWVLVSLFNLKKLIHINSMLIYMVNTCLW